METIYRELQAIRKDVNQMKLALIPVEKISEKERKQIRQTFREMEAGKEKALHEIFQ
ncbi:MAG: hypothetical protein HY917_00560 [Candidatus Diapherotrites archaeon]|nr:hypothetical protein [Candidatus Diapherotrites archaeon]